MGVFASVAANCPPMITSVSLMPTVVRTESTEHVSSSPPAYSVVTGLVQGTVSSVMEMDEREAGQRAGFEVTEGSPNSAPSSANCAGAAPTYTTGVTAERGREGRDIYTFNRRSVRGEG